MSYPADNTFTLGHFWAVRSDSGISEAPPLLLMRTVYPTGPGGMPLPDHVIELDPCEGCGADKALARTAPNDDIIVGLGHREGCTWLTETLADPDRDWYLVSPEENGLPPAGPDSATLVSVRMHNDPGALMFSAVRSREALWFLASVGEFADVNTLPWEALPEVRAAACGLIASQSRPNIVVPIGSTEDGETWATWYPPVPQPPVPALPS